MDLWIPDSEHNRRVEGQRQFLSDLLRQGGDLERIKWANRLVKQVDPYCEVFKAHDTANHPALKAGYWHIVRKPPVGFPAVVIHQGPKGEYRDLDSSILQTIREADMWSSERQRDAKKMAERAKKAQEREEEREREARVQEITERLKARTSPGVFIGRGLSST